MYNFCTKKILKYKVPCKTLFESVYATHKNTLKDVKNVLEKETCSVIGYGPQGKAQALNLRDTGVNVCVGAREDGESWNNAIKDKFIPNKTLFPINEAVNKGSIIMFLLSDAGQIEVYPTIKDALDNKTLYFSHGFGVVYNKLTKINVHTLNNVDVIMVAPKGSGKSVRDLYVNNTATSSLDGKYHGINSSYAVYRDDSRSAEKKALAIGFGIGSPYIYKTTFENEVYSDLTGERGILMGGIAGLFKAQYDVLREKGHSPSEAYNETVEEALQSLYPLIHENGMDYMFSNCSSTAQRGALDWCTKFENLNKPLFREIYYSVKSGREARRTIGCNSIPNYKERLDNELDNINNMEIWKVGKEIRKLRNIRYEEPTPSQPPSQSPIQARTRT